MATTDTSGGFDLGALLGSLAIEVGGAAISGGRRARGVYREGFQSDEEFKRECYNLELDPDGFVKDMDAFDRCANTWSKTYTDRERRGITRTAGGGWPPANWKIRDLREFESFGVGNEMEGFAKRPNRSIAALPIFVSSIKRQAIQSAEAALRKLSRLRLTRLPGSGSRVVPVIRKLSRVIPGAGVAVIVGEQGLKAFEKFRIGSIRRGGAVLSKSAQARIEKLGGGRGLNKAINAQKRELADLEKFAFKELQRSRQRGLYEAPPLPGIPRPKFYGVRRPGVRPGVRPGTPTRIKGTVSEITVPRRLQQRRTTVPKTVIDPPIFKLLGQVQDFAFEAIKATRAASAIATPRAAFSVGSIQSSFAPQPSAALAPLTALKAQSVKSRCRPCEKGSRRKPAKRRRKRQSRKVCFER